MSNYYCLNCGNIVPAGKKFCPVCGDPVIGNNTLQTTQIPFPADPVSPVENTVDYVPVQEAPAEETQQNAKTIAVESPRPRKQAAPVKEKKQSWLSSIFFEEVEVDDDEDVPEKKEKKHSVLGTILIILLAVLVGAFAYLYFEKPSVLNGALQKVGLGLPGYSQPVAAATASPSASAAASASPSASATAESTNIGSLVVKAESINIRDAASTSGNAIGKTTKGSKYDVLAVKTDDSYNWYEIGTNRWIADQNGEWVTYTAK
jgi:hypothetical protein